MIIIVTMNEYTVWFTGKVIESGYAEVKIGDMEQEGYISIQQLKHVRYERQPSDISEPMYFVYKLMEKPRKKMYGKITGEILGKPLLTVKNEEF